MKKFISFIFKYIYALISVFYLFGIGFFFSRNRSLIVKICNHFGYRQKSNKTIKPILPQIEITEMIPEHPSVILREPAWADGNVSLFELVVMNQMIRKSHPSRLFEMGTFDGRTALNMAANSPEDAVVYTLDLPVEKINETALPIASGDAQHIQKDQSGSRYLRTCEKKKIAQLYGDTASFDFSPYFNGMEFVFIDASHSYEYVLNDSRIALRLLKNGRGLILWHDYGTFDGVTKALNELYAGDPQFKGARHIKETSLVCLSL